LNDIGLPIVAKITAIQKSGKCSAKENQNLWLLGFNPAKFEGSFGSHNLGCVFKRRATG
jgi:hypothetical protein